MVLRKPRKPDSTLRSGGRGVQARGGYWLDTSMHVPSKVPIDLCGHLMWTARELRDAQYQPPQQESG